LKLRRQAEKRYGPSSQIAIHLVTSCIVIQKGY
jgi:hypothetical protein